MNSYGIVWIPVKSCAILLNFMKSYENLSPERERRDLTAANAAMRPVSLSIGNAALNPSVACQHVFVWKNITEDPSRLVVNRHKIWVDSLLMKVHEVKRYLRHLVQGHG